MDRTIDLMKNTFLFIACLTLAASAAPRNQERAEREKTNIDVGWRYLQGDQPGAEAPSYDDAAWSTVSLPHTFNYTTLDNAGYYRGKGWYRKHLQLPADGFNKRFTLYFEGAMTVADVWINGTKLPTHYGGFNPFCYDITDYLLFDGADNVGQRRPDLCLLRCVSTTVISRSFHRKNPTEVKSTFR